jgi:hypothetical protein
LKAVLQLAAELCLLGLAAAAQGHLAARLGQACAVGDEQHHLLPGEAGVTGQDGRDGPVKLAVILLERQLGQDREQVGQELF